MRSNNEIAQDTQDKYERYVLALTFTILGLSIQTAHFGAGGVAATAEILSWLSLFASGLFGLSRWEKTPGIYEKFHSQDEAKARAMNTGRAILGGTQEVHGLLDGTTVPAKDSFETDKHLVARLGEVLKKANASQVRRYRVQKWLFLGGLALLVLARAYAPVRYVLPIAHQRLGY